MSDVQNYPRLLGYDFIPAQSPRPADAVCDELTVNIQYFQCAYRRKRVINLVLAQHCRAVLHAFVFKCTFVVERTFDIQL